MGSEVYIDDYGTVLVHVHDRGTCNSDPCPIHNQSEKAKSIGKQLWRSDRGIMERVCEHGVGHPDPDDIRVRTVDSEGIHGCDGCCH